MLAGLLLLAGCGPDIDLAIKMDAFAPDGTQRSSVEGTELADAQRRGLVVAYQQGDVVELTVSMQSNWIEHADPVIMDLNVLRPIWLYTGPGGVYLSTDGSTFRAWSDAVHGNLSFGVSLSEAKKANVASVRLQANIAD